MLNVVVGFESIKQNFITAAFFTFINNHDKNRLQAGGGFETNLQLVSVTI